MSCGHQVTRLASGYSATSSSDATPSAWASAIELQQDHQSRQPAAPRGTPAPAAAAARPRRAAGRRCAPPGGRCRGPTGRSPRSPPTRITRRADGEQQDQPHASRRRRAGQQDPPQPRQEQQPDADRPVDAGPAADRAASGRGSRATQPVATMSVCGLHALLLCAAAMTGSIRLHVTSSAGRGRHASPRRGAGALPWQRHAARARRRACGCSTAATANSPPASRPIRRDRASLRVEQPTRDPGAGARSLAGIRAAEARCHRSGRAEGDRTRRRRADAGDHRADQHAPDERRTA